jgi:uncharacterized protein YecT (DUF1311 family)
MHRGLRALPALLALSCGGVAWAGAPNCKTATKQVDLSACAYEEFLDAHAQQVQVTKALNARLDGAQRKRWDSAQASWVRWRTSQCDFESAGVGTGSAREMLQWRCVARMTRERTGAIERLASCREGDIACVRSRR